MSNLPDNKWPTKGGPSRNTRLLSNLFTEKGYAWVGLVEKYEGDKITSELIKGKKNKKWWIVSTPKEFLYTRHTGIKKYKKPIIAGKELIAEITKIIKEEQPDVVFINGSSAFSWEYLRAAYSVGTPIVALHAGLWGVEIDLYADRFTPDGIKVMKEMERDFATLPTVNVFLNETTKNYFRKNIYKIPESKIEIIPLPCESYGVPKIKKNIVKNDINIGIVARWDRIKNHRAFLGVAKESVEDGKNWKFFAVTTIPDTNIDKELKDEYRKKINVVAPMDQKSLRNFYRKMDLLLLPSFFDVSPHVVLEAALEGVPTFISKNVGYADLFKKNKLENFIVDFSNHKKAFSKISSFRNKKYPQKFVNLLKKTHDPHTVVNKLERLFNKIKK